MFWLRGCTLVASIDWFEDETSSNQSLEATTVSLTVSPLTMLTMEHVLTKTKTFQRLEMQLTLSDVAMVTMLSENLNRCLNKKRRQEKLKGMQIFFVSNHGVIYAYWIKHFMC